MLFYLLFFLDKLSMARTPTTMLVWRWISSDIPPDLKRNIQSFLLRKMLPVSFLQVSFVSWRGSLSPSLLSVFYKKMDFVTCFLYLLRWPCDFVLLMWCWFSCLTNFAFLEWIPLDSVYNFICWQICHKDFWVYIQSSYFFLFG